MEDVLNVKDFVILPAFNMECVIKKLDELEQRIDALSKRIDALEAKIKSVDNPEPKTETFSTQDFPNADAGQIMRIIW